VKFSKLIYSTVSAAGLALLCGASLAQTTTKVDLGKQEYNASCAVCHGSTGKGNGPYTPLLKIAPPDMTQLAKQNGGVLPINRLYEMIEGIGVPSHGTRDMPIWGRAYRLQAGEYYVDTPYDAEAFVRTRILSLVEYINRLQVK
jgi:mono/diheme cytochrome c family protein